MKRNIDLTENRDFAKKISKRIFSAREILYENIRDQDDFESYISSHCYCCGKEFKEYPWIVNKALGLCKVCDSKLVSCLGRKCIRENPFLKNKITSAKFIFKDKDYEKPWFIGRNKITISDFS